MAKKGGQPGNSNAARGKEFSEQLRYVLEHYENSTIERGMALRGIAEKLIEKALAGDQSAIIEVANRLDGKPTEHRESVVLKTVEHIAVQTTASWLEQFASEPTGRIPAKSKPN